ncbi:hypothetical protein BKA93DRAFT_826571 [Sparassis latifolia]|uniref:Uncharacterized protein n=1 Tax=Sparassis crispa TaxID=139825 RepID=A0A401GEA5_9APHY|nr:hypothetical protein SCP_0302270 [Sparassis crispa]GBE80512.1 hypothetical protein SCP_0302270 [Sparassis crispa]
MAKRIAPRLYASLPHSIYTLSTYYSRLTPYSWTLMGLNGDHTTTNRLVVAALNAEPTHGAANQAIHGSKMAGDPDALLGTFTFIDNLSTGDGFERRTPILLLDN